MIKHVKLWFTTMFYVGFIPWKTCCNCSNFVPCILWDFIVLGLVLSWWRLKLKWRIIGFREKLNGERACEEHMTGSWRVMPGCRFHECVAGKAIPRDSRETFCPHDFYVWIPYPSPILYIPSLLTNVKEAIRKEKTLDRFSTTHTHLFERELLILSEN